MDYGITGYNYGTDSYLLKNTYVSPSVQSYYPYNSIYTPPSVPANDTSKPKDGKDDGSIGFFSAIGHALKGGVKLFTKMFTDENGDFSLKQTFKTLGTVALIGAATFIPVIGPFVLPTLCAVGMVDGGLKVAKGFVNAMDAKTDAEAEQAFEQIGEGATEGLLSYAGYKQTGGFKGAWDKVKPAPSNNTPQIEAPKEVAAKTKLDKAKNVEPQGPKHNELAENVRRDIVNEKAAKVDAGKSTNPTNAEIAEQGKNLDIKHVSAKEAKLVENAYKDVPTAKQQAAYDQQIAYQKPTKAQQKALDNMHKKNATEYSKAHEVQNLTKDADKLVKAKEQLASVETSPKTLKNGEYMLDGNRYVIKDGKIVEMQLKGQQKPQTKELAIVKHENKNNILERLLNENQNTTKLDLAA